MHLRDWLVVACLQCLVLGESGAQTVEQSDVLARATSLSSSGEIAAVVDLLEPFVGDNSASAEAWLLLAQHQYWNQQTGPARRTFERGLAHHPHDTRLRLAYGRFLLENGHLGAAVAAVQTLGDEHADAEVIRGTVAWWRGRLTRAVRHFKSALRTNPDHPEAAAGLAAIRAESRPWFRVSGEHADDSQPLTYRRTHAEGGIFITPLRTVRAELTHTQFATENAAEPVTTLFVENRSVWPSLGVETDLALGLASRTDTTEWTGRLRAALQMPYGLRLQASWERAPYQYTAASISQSVMSTKMQTGASLEARGWLGEAAVGRETFQDANKKSVIFGWLMAPLLDTTPLTIRGGYAYSYQDTDEHRFTPVMATEPRPGQAPSWGGRYDPYHTPLNARSHSITGSIALRPASFLTLRANGSYAVAGSEEAPFVYVVGRAPVTGTYEHEVHPWNVRAGADIKLNSGLSLHLEASHMETTWYDASDLNLSLYVRL